jgi:hypothetical protein
MATASASTFSRHPAPLPWPVQRFLALPGPVRVAAGLGLVWAVLVTLFASIGFFDPAE